MHQPPTPSSSGSSTPSSSSIPSIPLRLYDHLRLPPIVAKHLSKGKLSKGKRKATHPSPTHLSPIRLTSSPPSGSHPYVSAYPPSAFPFAHLPTQPTAHPTPKSSASPLVKVPTRPAHRPAHSPILSRPLACKGSPTGTNVGSECIQIQRIVNGPIECHFCERVLYF